MLREEKRHTKKYQISETATNLLAKNQWTSEELRSWFRISSLTLDTISTELSPLVLCKLEVEKRETALKKFYNREKFQLHTDK